MVNWFVFATNMDCYGPCLSKLLFKSRHGLDFPEIYLGEVAAETLVWDKNNQTDVINLEDYMRDYEIIFYERFGKYDIKNFWHLTGRFEN